MGIIKNGSYSTTSAVEQAMIDNITIQANKYDKMSVLEVSPGSSGMEKAYVQVIISLSPGLSERERNIAYLVYLLNTVGGKNIKSWALAEKIYDMCPLFEEAVKLDYQRGVCYEFLPAYNWTQDRISWLLPIIKLNGEIIGLDFLSYVSIKVNSKTEKNVTIDEFFKVCFLSEMKASGKKSVLENLHSHNAISNSFIDQKLSEIDKNKFIEWDGGEFINGKFSSAVRVGSLIQTNSTKYNGDGTLIIRFSGYYMIYRI